MLAHTRASYATTSHIAAIAHIAALPSLRLKTKLCTQNRQQRAKLLNHV